MWTTLRALPALVITGLLVASTAAIVIAEDDGPSAGFATPEEAAQAYLDAFAAADLEALLDAVAIDEVADGYRFDLAIDRVQSFGPFGLLAPSEYEFLADVNRAEQRARVARQALNLAYSLMTDLDLMQYMSDLDRAWAMDFIDGVDPATLDGLTIVDIRTPQPDRMDDTRMQVINAQVAKVNGADERTERVALLSFESDLYLVGFSLLRYGDDWKVFDQSSALGRASALGDAVPTTSEEFDEITSGS